MAANKLTKCKSCGNEIAKSAKSCPSCGAKNKKPIFTKWWFWVLIVLLIAGIGGGAGGNDSDEAATSPTKAVAAKEAKPAETTTAPTTTAAPTVVSVDEMLDLLDENALKAEKTYNGMYVEMTGILDGIDSDGKYFSLTRNDGELTFINVMCMIDKKYTDTVMEFEKEQKVTVVGKVTSVGEVMGYTIDVESIK